MIGMAMWLTIILLYYEAVNEKGLGMAGLNFVGNAHYGEKADGKVMWPSLNLFPGSWDSVLL